MNVNLLTGLIRGKNKPGHKNLSFQFFTQLRGINSRFTGVFTIKMNPRLYGQILT
jgi:hypothetical protein